MLTDTILLLLGEALDRGVGLRLLDHLGVQPREVLSKLRGTPDHQPPAEVPPVVGRKPVEHRVDLPPVPPIETLQAVELHGPALPASGLLRGQHLAGDRGEDAGLEDLDSLQSLWRSPRGRARSASLLLFFLRMRLRGRLRRGRLSG
jgi:hypothetical protein